MIQIRPRPSICTGAFAVLNRLTRTLVYDHSSSALPTPKSQMSWSASVVTAATSDTEPTIILTFDHAKYLFNVGENTNRAFFQSKFRWSRTRAVFLTQANIQRASGLGGTLMTFADSASIKKVDVVGPPGTLHYLAAMRTYTFRADMAVNVREAPLDTVEDLSPTPIYKSEHIHVYAIPLISSQDVAKSEYEDPSSVSESISGSPPVSLKRKRGISPNRPEKRPSTFTPGADKIWSLEELRRDPDFSPSLLEGDAAEEWRKLIVTTMFPAQQGESKKKLSKTKEKAQTETDEVIHDDYRGSRRKPPGGFLQQLPKYDPQNSESFSSALSYVIVGPRTRGKFDIVKANALGVLKWQRGKLTKGESVTVSTQANGETITRTVNPEDCIGPSEIPSLVMIFDVPTPFHIDSLVDTFERSSFYRKFRSNHPDNLAEASVRAVFHICGEGVLEDERYCTFMQGFPSQTEHIISSREHSPDPVNFTSAAFNHLRLNQLDPVMFPVPKHTLTTKKRLKDLPNLPEKVMVMEANIVVSMRPPCPAVLDNDPARDRFHPAIRTPGPCELPPATLERFNEARRKIEMCIAAGNIPKPPGGNVGILPLGTGSSLPSKYRNVSSTLIQIPGWGNVLLDAGEGTWGQLNRHFGSEASISPNVWDALKDLKCIFISHIHGDHHMGVAKILSMRQQLVPPPTKPLYLVANRSVHLYLRELSDIENLGINDPSGNGIIPVMSEALHWKRSGTYIPTGMWAVGGDEPWTDIQLSQTHATTMCRSLGFKMFVTIDVYHKTKCYGVYFKHRDGWSIVFSGDTMPTDTLVYAAKNATVLIHEATMGDDQEDMAKRKGHSTIGQALEVGKKMKAENILLTHFSARYPKMPPHIVTRSDTDLEKDPEKRNPVVALGFDHVDMTIGTLWKMNRYLPAIEQSFLDTAEEGDEEDEKEALRATEVAIDVA